MYNEMPKPRQVADDAFVANWDRIHAVRDDVLKALEEARNSKIIGKPQEAKVTLTASEELYGFLKAYENDLAMLFIVSQTALEKGQGTGGGVEGLSVKVEKADGTVCPRCWNYSHTVGSNENHAEVCARCAAILG